MSELMSGLKWGEVKEVGKDSKHLNRIIVQMKDTIGVVELPYASVLTDCAGDGWGKIVLPNKGDTVIVGFIDGDIENPVILGSIPTQKTKPPYNVKNSNNEVKYYKTKSGMTLEINENSKNSRAVIKTSNGNSITLNDNTKSQMAEVKGGNISLRIDFKTGSVEIKSNTMKFSAAKKINMQVGGTSLTLDNQKFEVKSAAGEMSVKTASINMTANAIATLKSNNMLNVQASGVANFKGSLTKIG